MNRGTATLIVDRCRLWFGKLLARAEAFTSGRWWQVKTTLLCVFFTIFLNGAVGFDSMRTGYYKGYYEKIEHPLKDMTLSYPPESHQAKLNFRLTVPVILHVLGLRAYWILPALTALAIVGILFLSCVLTWQITGNRLVALFMALEVSATYTGSFGVVFYYDAIALAWVALLLLNQVPWYLRSVIVFAAAFTDERGFLASLFAIPFFATFSKTEGARFPRLINRDVVGILAGMALYFAVRLWLQYHVGLRSTFEGLGLEIFVQHIRFWHAGTWFALEGGWLFVFFAVVSLVLRKQFLRLVVFLIPICGILYGGLLDGDVLRCTACLFPAIFVSLKILSEHESDWSLIRFAVIALFLSVLSGNYNIFLEQITWFQSLPAYLIRKTLIALFGLKGSGVQYW